MVYPACAGIHPLRRPVSMRTLCLPRMRGDPPDIVTQPGRDEESTPHARGSTVA